VPRQANATKIKSLGMSSLGTKESWHTNSVLAEVRERGRKRTTVWGCEV